MTSKRISINDYDDDDLIKSDYEYAKKLYNKENNERLIINNNNLLLTKKFLENEYKCDSCQEYKKNGIIIYLNNCKHKICKLCLKIHIINAIKNKKCNQDQLLCPM